MKRSLIALVLAAIVLVVYAPIVLGGRTWNDVRYHTEIAPPRIAAADAVLHGEIPTWWNGSALGVPLLGEPTHGAVYPLGWIAATPRALDLFALVHVLWCALGVAIWARRRESSDLGAVVSGALVVTSGVIVGALLRGALPALAHLPWLALAASALARATSRGHRARYAIAVAVALGLIGLAGQLSIFAQALVLVVLLLASRWRRLLLVVVAGVAIASVQWLPALMIAGTTAGATSSGLSIAHAIDLVIPRASEAWLPTVYIGAPALVLGVLGRPQRRFAAFAAVLLVLAFIAGPLQLAALAILAAAHAGVGFDRVAAWFSRRLLVVIIVLAPTAVALPLLVPTVDRSLVDEPPAWASAAITAHEVAVREGKAQPGAPVRVFRPVMHDKHLVDDDLLADATATLAGNSAATWGIGTARSEDPARPAVHDRVWLAAAAAGGALLDRFGVDLAVLPASMIGDTDKARVAARDRVALVRLPASPPAALVYEWIFAPDVTTALARLFPPGASTGLSSGMIVLQGQGAQNQDEPGSAKPCAIERWSGAAIDVHCAVERAAFHVVSSTAMRGWSVTVDDRETPWVVADVMRRAVALPAGEHRIAWRYWPPGFTAALVLLALGSAGLLALWLLYGRDPHAQDRTPDPARTDES